MALYLRKKLENKAEIAVWQVTETEEELRNLVSVPTDELEEISLYREESHRRQKLAVRALLNEVFEEKMYLNHHDNGKPYLENSVTNISITHTDKYVAIIISDDDELGIDIESLDRDFESFFIVIVSQKRKNSRRVVHSENPLSRKKIVNVAGQCIKMRNLFYVFFLV